LLKREKNIQMAEEKGFRPLFGRTEQKEDPKKEKQKKEDPKREVQKKEEPKKDDRTAVAIEYVPGEAAPKILATGKGLVADKIVETAKENDVPLYKDDKLADTLSRLKIGDMIPPELYEVVAEILVFVDDMDRLKAKLGK
jgi:flagellar biosynthesis protein